MQKPSHMAGFLFHLIFSAIFFGATKNPAVWLGFLFFYVSFYVRVFMSECELQGGAL